MALTHQSGLSELWVGSIYETIRLLRDRGLAPDTAAFQSLARDLKLLRIPLEKHEITEDRGLKKPLRMIRMPPNNDGTDIYEYRKDDPTRAHIMQSGISHQDSMMWQVIDPQARQERWIERRDLSDRFLSWAETVQAEINKSNETSEVNG